MGGAQGRELTHRLAWVEAYGPIPPEFPQVLHHCDNPPCRRLSHLFVGTAADNVRDMHAKGRARQGRSDGEHNPRARLTEGDVREIRRRAVKGSGDNKGLDAGNLKQLAVEYGVSHSAILNAVNRKTWANVE